MIIMTMKISLIDINHLITVIGENKAEKITWLMNKRPYKLYSLSISQLYVWCRGKTVDYLSKCYWFSPTSCYMTYAVCWLSIAQIS